MVFIHPNQSVEELGVSVAYLLDMLASPAKGGFVLCCFYKDATMYPYPNPPYVATWVANDIQHKTSHWPLSELQAHELFLASQSNWVLYPISFSEEDEDQEVKIIWAINWHGPNGETPTGQVEVKLCPDSESVYPVQISCHCLPSPGNPNPKKEEVSATSEDSSSPLKGISDLASGTTQDEVHAEGNGGVIAIPGPSTSCTSLEICLLGTINYEPEFWDPLLISSTLKVSPKEGPKRAIGGG